uniref:Uncharacterized protein n=1 Tax=Anguilla anguilla TaxID=7936 RepID=A0A0E9SNS4_ANGAN
MIREIHYQTFLFQSNGHLRDCTRANYFYKN